MEHRVDARAAVDSSLPLMGIGNPGTSSALISSTVISLPLMGIGNPDRQRGRTLRVPPLITPHGDRKQEVMVKLSGKQTNSLPLMGIGNMSKLAK